ncbi:MAG: DUF4296 domain-containing protein [Flavobacteriales bacterium]|nr:DUF4296 domain-containing protein [Flavobacteriales bacterium]
MRVLLPKKNYLFVLILFVSSLFFGCAEEKTRTKPASVLTGAEMVAILTDIQLIEGAVSKKIIDRNASQKESPIYYEKVFEKHEITRQQFSESIAYYSEKPEELQIIYEKVLVELSTIKAELQNTKEKTVEETK